MVASYMELLTIDIVNGTTDYRYCQYMHPGTATRMCYENETWGAPDVLSCQSLEILRVSQEVYTNTHTGIVQNMQ